MSLNLVQGTDEFSLPKGGRHQLKNIRAVTPQETTSPSVYIQGQGLETAGDKSVQGESQPESC